MPLCMMNCKHIEENYLKFFNFVNNMSVDTAYKQLVSQDYMINQDKRYSFFFCSLYINLTSSPISTHQDEVIKLEKKKKKV